MDEKSWTPPKVVDSSAVLEMDIVDDKSDYEDFQEPGSIGAHERRREKEEDPGGLMGEMQQKLGGNVTSFVWQAGKQQAQRAYSLYGNIDILRPYFDVEPHQVKTRLLQSLIPKMSGDDPQKVPRELYGPLMLVLTMIAVLLFQMKSSGHVVQEGTLMGSAFAICFGYWIGVSSIIWVLAYICNTHMNMVQILSLLGYGLFGHNIVLFLSTVFHSGHTFFYITWAVFGGLATLKMVSVLSSRTVGQSQKMIVCGVVAAIHMLFLIYLHFAYHRIVEDLSAALNERGVPSMLEHTDSVHAGIPTTLSHLTPANQQPPLQQIARQGLPDGNANQNAAKQPLNNPSSPGAPQPNSQPQNLGAEVPNPAGQPPNPDNLEPNPAGQPLNRIAQQQNPGGQLPAGQAPVMGQPVQNVGAS